MKKLLTGIISLVLAASMTVPAFAGADNSATLDGTDGASITVNGKYQAGAPAAEKISVDLVWEAMDFTYTAPSKGTWNAKDHKYEGATVGGWAATNGTDPKITVTNHSNIPVKASFAFTATVTGVEGIGTETAASAYKPELGKDEIDEITKQINDAAAALKTALDGAQIGTDYTTASIIANIKAILDRLKVDGNLAFSDAYRPLRQDGYGDVGYPLPDYFYDIQINVAGDTEDIEFAWSMSQTDYAELAWDYESGCQRVNVTGTPTTPQTVTLTATAEGYGVVGTYTCVIGAPIAIDTTATVSAPELTSGNKETFTVEIPVMGPASAAINAEMITATCSDTTLLTGIKVTGAEIATNAEGNPVMKITLSATTKSLPAVVVPVDSTAPAPEAGTLTLTVPSSAITLTDVAKNEGWIAPNNDLTLTTDVKVCPPTLKVVDVYAAGVYTRWVYVFTEHWDGSTLGVALVPTNVADYAGSAEGSASSSAFKVCLVSGEISQEIYTYDKKNDKLLLEKGKEYYVWVTLDKGYTWTNSNYLYTYN